MTTITRSDVKADEVSHFFISDGSLVAIDLATVSKGYPLLCLSRRIAANDARCTYREMLEYFEEICSHAPEGGSLRRHPWLARWVNVLPLALSTLLRAGVLRHPSFTPQRWPEMS